MNLPVEDEYHCNKRHLALVTVIFLLIIIPTPVWCLNVTYIVLSHQLSYPQFEIEQYLNKAADTIHYYTGLNTEINIRIILHPDSLSFNNHDFPSWSAAVYREGEIHLRNPYLLLKKGIFKNILSHELFHAVVHQNGLFLPQWFEEGFAYFLFPTSIPKLNDKRYDADFFKLESLEFYNNSYIMVKKLMREKSQKEIRDFFLFCQEVGFYSALSQFSQVSAY